MTLNRASGKGNKNTSDNDIKKHPRMNKKNLAKLTKMAYPESVLISIMVKFWQLLALSANLFLKRKFSISLWFKMIV